MGGAFNIKILFVDDEQSILDAFRRQLRGKFQIETTIDIQTALKILKEKQDYAVVVSDMRMPEMDGASFLNIVKDISPETVRLMLTGNADQETAARAVNEGNIFRFLNKPCATDELLKALNDAVSQYQLITAEKELLNNTLGGSVKLLTDILSLIDPESFGETLKNRELIKRICVGLGIGKTWEIELAAMLSNIGMVTVPTHVTAKLRKKHSLSKPEQDLIARIPEIGSQLIANIPRLETVSKIVKLQDSDLNLSLEIPIGARIIRVLKTLSKLEEEGISLRKGIQAMSDQPEKFDRQVLLVVAQVMASTKIQDGEQQTVIYEIESEQLKLGHTLLSNIETKEGVLLVAAGTKVTPALLERLENYSKFVGIREPVKVDSLVPN